MCDSLATIGEKMEDVDLVNVALNGLPKSWEHFSREFVLKKIFHIG